MVANNATAAASATAAAVASAQQAASVNQFQVGGWVSDAWDKQ